MNKNHEGYHDPTACEAIRRLERQSRKIRQSELPPSRLVYYVNEVQGLKVARKLIQR